MTTKMKAKKPASKKVVKKSAKAAPKKKVKAKPVTQEQPKTSAEAWLRSTNFTGFFG